MMNQIKKTCQTLLVVHHFSKSSCNILESTRLQHLLNVSITFVWTTHLVLVFWGGTWDLFDIYVLPDDAYTGSWISFFGGALVSSVFFAFLFPLFQRHITSDSQVRVTST